MSQIVNRRDLSFLLFECLHVETLFASPRYQRFDAAAVEQILDLGQAIAEEKYLPFAAALDANEPKFVDGKVEIMPEVGEALHAYAEAGFMAASFDEALGGLQMPYVASMALNGMFVAANLAVSNYFFLTIANANLIAAFGSEDQKRRFLPPMLEGRWLGTMCLSEPQAGSSLTDVQTRAELREDGAYRISGSKMWISGGDHEICENIIHLVLARIKDAPPGVKGLSLFIVPKHQVLPDGSLGPRNGIELAGLNHKMGQRGTTNCLLNFGESGEFVGHLIGEQNKGLAIMFHMMNEARIGVGHASTMSGLAGFLCALDYARGRPQGRHPHDKDPRSPQIPIIEHADVKRMLMAQKAAVEGALALCCLCALLVDQQRVTEDDAERADLGLLLDLLTPIAKSWPAEHCLEANKWAIQVLGGSGYVRDFPVERLYRDNRLNHIHEGALGIQAIDLLGRKLRLADGRGLILLTKRMLATVHAAAQVPGLESEAAALRAAVTDLFEVSAVLLDCQDLNRSLANATLYLDVFGQVVIAWIWLWQALVAQAGMKDLAVDAAFYEGKLAACRYFYRYELPGSLAQLDLLRGLDETCAGLTAVNFIGI